MADASTAAPNGLPAPAPAGTVEVRVLESGTDCNIYLWDADLGAPRLNRIVRPSPPRGADLARLPLLSGFTVRTAAGQGGEASDAPQRKFRFGELMERTAAPKPPVSDTIVGALDTSHGLEGPGLLALLLADPPNPPGAWVQAHVLGAWRPTEARGARDGTPELSKAASTRDSAERDSLEALLRWTLIVLPVVDTALQGITDVTTLPAAVRGRLAQGLGSVGATASRGELPSGEWLDATAAFDLCQQARLLARRTRGAMGVGAIPAGGSRTPRRQDEEGRAYVAWRVLAGVSAAELRALGPGAYSEAEHLLRFVPVRFGRYLSELLWPDERILFFAERTAIGPRQGRIRPLLPKRSGARLQAGLLLLTTQQVLCIRDYAPPDATLVDWGYLARAYPLGRMVGAAVLPPGATVAELDLALLPGLSGTPDERLAAVRTALQAADPETRRELGAERLARLILVVAAHGAIEVAGMAMPDGARGGLDWTAAFLRACTPRLGAEVVHDRRLRPVPMVEPWRPSAHDLAALEGLGGEIAPELRNALEAALAEALEPDETWLVTARSADLSVTGGGQVAAHAMGLTAQRLVLVTVRTNRHGRAGQPPHRAVTVRALGELTSATVQRSLLGCALWATRPQAQVLTHRAGAHTIPEIAIGFASPASEPFQALFVRLRTLLGGALSTQP